MAGYRFAVVMVHDARGDARTVRTVPRNRLMPKPENWEIMDRFEHAEEAQLATRRLNEVLFGEFDAQGI